MNDNSSDESKLVNASNRKHEARIIDDELKIEHDNH